MAKITAEEFDRKFDDGEDVSEYLDWSQTKTGDIGRDLFLVKLSERSAGAISVEAKRLGIPVDELISRWIEERLKPTSASAAE